MNKDKQKYKLVKQKYFIDEDNNEYKVDGKHVVLNPSDREKEVARMLGEIYGEEIKLIPRVNEPEKIKTPDYIINEEKFDLKEITGTGKYVIEGNLKGKQKQANNFIIDITNSKIKEEEVIKQIENVYKSKRYLWVSKIFLIKGYTFIRMYERN